MFAVFLFEMRLGGDFVRTVPFVLAFAGLLLSLAIISLVRWLGRGGLRDQEILPQRYLVNAVWIWALLGVAAFAHFWYLDEQRPHGNEASATATLRTLNTAMVDYGSTYNRGFPETLNKLASPSPGQPPDANHSDLVDRTLSGLEEGTPRSFAKNGYWFTYTPGRAVSAKITTYTITADPLERGQTGQRSFFTNESCVIRANATAVATASDSPI